MTYRHLNDLSEARTPTWWQRLLLKLFPRKRYLLNTDKKGIYLDVEVCRFFNKTYVINQQRRFYGDKNSTVQ